MQDAILASLFHVASSENDNFHVYCPKTYDSWCQYQRDAINNTNVYTPGAGISNDVIAAIKPVYADLTKPDILQKMPSWSYTKPERKLQFDNMGEGPESSILWFGHIRAGCI